MRILPVDEVLPKLLGELAKSSRAVLTAPPGSGKTTRVPLALLAADWLADNKILLLEPRRLAARTAAVYMASLYGEKVGATVGYRTRLDSKAGPQTRIEVITEGILTRMLQADPALNGVGAVIFDEFHERSLQSDLGLALCLQTQSLFRPELRLLVMSATLDGAAVAGLLGEAPVLTGQGQSYPVKTCWLQQEVLQPLETVVAAKVTEALAAETGGILVFLPGEAEIRRVEALLRQPGALPSEVCISPLYGRLPPPAQDAAILPAPPGLRKVVLATAIAETSLTVEGISLVIDSGLTRQSRFSPRTGMTHLETVRVSQAAADQRRGRAGRLGPGVCWRLWTQAAEARLERYTKPEILEADLASLALELAVWGAEPAELRWLDMPPEPALEQARQLLQRLGAVDGGKVTAHGRRMAASGLHPRLAHMILAALPLKLGGLACDAAALLSERLPGSADADLRPRLEYLRQNAEGYRLAKLQADRWRRLFAVNAPVRADLELCGLVIGFAYPDRIAQRRPNGRFLLANGRGGYFAAPQPLAQADYLCIAAIDDKGEEGRILLAAPVALADIRRHFAGAIRIDCNISWDKAAKAVRSRRLERLAALVLQETPLAEPEPQAISDALLAGIADSGLAVLPWSRQACQLRQRVAFMRLSDSGWPDWSDGTLLATLHEWLGPYLYGLKSLADLARINLTAVLEALLSWEQRQSLELHAPARLTVPSGQSLAIDYSDPAAPALAVRLQAMFGLAVTPCIGKNRVPLTLQLLSPAQRPVQVTKDLASFWRTGYFAVKRDLMGRYPKHYWPDDPLQAPPTQRIRPR
ncbi:MAG: ATP-dependent helicase HrpB [Sporomusaceae bacterium]|nr:ATP-dependent helicase HrpB [Sporomusaceae bacterium]